MILPEERVHAQHRRAVLAAAGVAAAAAAAGWLASAGLAPAWEALLEQHVAFFRALDEAGRARFRRGLALFLAEKHVTGVDVPVDDEARVLVAASAVIPVFGLEEWAYRSVVEVLVYPESFDEEYEVRARRGDMLGMAPSQTSTTILSLPALLEGFGPRAERMHVGIHEFLHAIDGEDGEVDGFPTLLMDAQTSAEWARTADENRRLLDRGGGIVDLYAAEDEAELFAVAGEPGAAPPRSLRDPVPHPAPGPAVARQRGAKAAGRAGARPQGAPTGARSPAGRDGPRPRRARSGSRRP